MTDYSSPSAGAIYRRLLRYVARYWRRFAVAVIGMAVVASADAGFVALIKPMLDGSFVQKDPFLIRAVPIALVAIFIARGFGSFAADTFMTRVGRDVIRDLRAEIFDRLLMLPSAYYDATPSSQLVSKMIYNIEQIAQAATKAVTVLVRDSLTIVGLLFVMLYMNWMLSLFFLAVGPVIMLLVLYVSRRLRRISRNIQSSVGDVTRVAQEAIEGQRVIKVHGSQDFERAQFRVANEANRRQNVKMAITGAAAEPITLLIGASAFAGVLFVATTPEMLQLITVGTFMSFISALMLLFSPVKRLTAINATLQGGITAAQSIFELLDTPVERDAGTQCLERARGRIEFRDVSFAYRSDAGGVLEKFSLIIEPGQTVAFVGKSGSGKTTLVSLLPRFYEVSGGGIYIDGIDVRDLRLQELRNQFAFVSQDVMLFNDTIAQNIAYGRLMQCSEDELLGAARAAHALEFIQRLPEGFDTMVGENGVLLSGGQRQRIAIARALLKDAPILILDEATSALDSESERYIQDALDHLTSNRTTLVIAHRLSTIEKADKIVVLDQGRLVEQGTHAELLARNGVYAQLHRRGVDHIEIQT